MWVVRTARLTPIWFRNTAPMSVSCPSGNCCSRCLQTGDECTYSKRRWHLPHLQQPRKTQQHPQQPQQPDRDRVHATHVLQHSASNAVPGHDGMLPLKRYLHFCCVAGLGACRKLTVQIQRLFYLVWSNEVGGSSKSCDYESANFHRVSNVSAVHRSHGS